jgi:hypothetical protein
MSESKEKKAAEDIDIKSLNIYEKMSRITSELKVVEKGLDVKINNSASYKAVSERDVLDKVKPLEAKYRVFSYPFSRIITAEDKLLKRNENYGKVTETTSFFMRIETVYRFVNIDKPEEYVEINTYGDGIDTGDKAPGKAMTYADKYALMKAYKISTGDDPDKEPSPEEGYKGKPKNEQKAEPKVKPKAEPTYPTMTGTKKVVNAPIVPKIEVNPEDVITPVQVQMLEAAISKYKISKENTHAVLRKYGYDNAMQIKVKDYENIVNDYKSMI